MQKNSRMKDIIIIGFALFAMFFGSGNLIFPPYLGRLVGSEYVLAMIGFMIMGVGLPLMGVMATAKVGGNFEQVGNKVGKIFSVILVTALILAIGPFLAIPRTAATTYEISVRPFLPHISSLVVIGLYFIINLCLVLNPNSIVDVIGKYLTPILLITLMTLIIKGVLFPIGPVTTTSLDNVFTNSLIEGYQTMDALAAVCFGGIIVNNIRSRGYKSSKEVIGLTLKSSLVAIIGLGVVYGGLMYLGTHTGHITGNMEKTALVSTIAHQVLGQAGTVFLGIAVALACLTTSVGLTATGAEYFSELFKGKISYKFFAIIISVISMGIALLGVDNIVVYTTPVLKILYPVIIVLVMLTLIGKWVDYPVIYKVVVYTTLIVVIVDVLAGTFQMAALQKLIGYIPLSNVGFAWILPAVIAFCMTKGITAYTTKE